MIKALLADDEPLIVRGLKKLLPWEQLCVQIAGEAFNGNQASQLLMTLKPEILISDICMPGKSGIDLLKEIRQADLSVKVIFLSGHQEFSYAKDAIAYGALDYILKPIDKGQLKQTVLKAKALIEKETEELQMRRRLSGYEKGRDVSRGENGPDDSRLPQDIQKVKAHIEAHYQQDISLETAAGIACMNPNYFCTFFKKHTGENFKDYLLRIRMEQALRLLMTTDCKTYELAERVGFHDPKHFSDMFKKFYGKNPMEYKKGL